MKLISLLNISFAYSGTDDLFTDLSYSFSVDKKVAIIGDNGVGKTTLLKIISGDLLPDSGRVVRSATCQLLNQINTDSTKSGGQSQQQALNQVFDSGADVLLLDEPTNNLDATARKDFFNKLFSYCGGAVIVSHDRELLNQMDTLLELHNGKLSVFGGNYDFYVAQKRQMQESIEAKYTDAQKEIARLNATIAKAQNTRQHHEAKQKKDMANKANGSRIDANALKGKSQETEAKRRNLIQTKLNKQIEYVAELSAQLRDDTIKIPLPNAKVYDKEIVRLENVCFAYGEKSVLSDFSFTMRTGERVRIIGNNGAGKTTVLKLISGILQPSAGYIKVSGKVAYLNQDLSLLNPNKSVVENISNYADILLHDAHVIAANFGFRGDTSKKKVGVLSGGELLKATLAAVIGSKNQPDLLILDEPTNNLDIKSTLILEDALNQYSGAILIVSHDEMFINNLHIDRFVNM
ncbi:MAG TPA: ABC-F family ATP-binding cassette domain-containing protein [Candidatus Enterousia avicola]|uniref:ABC-F family ATP-binding cassette domain-containing protein n=1 Tax=Candidatus Enterousia avicola TaxID=2840787 RepID=A0A9D1MSG3_9PROT|nr:ABC-F family ATP-binding cassette domain-containing protein [Candidatus Enterousia avicola]